MGAITLPNVTIGKNSVIGTETTVMKAIPPYTVMAGIPAKVIRSLSFGELKSE